MGRLDCRASGTIATGETGCGAVVDNFVSVGMESGIIWTSPRSTSHSLHRMALPVHSPSNVSPRDPEFAHRVVRPIARDLFDMTHTVWDRAKKNPDFHLMRHATRASLLYDLHIHLGREREAEGKWSVLETKDNFAVLRVHPIVCVRPQKLDGRFFKSNKKTHRQAEIRDQEHMMFGDDMHWVDLGYVPNPAWSDYAVLRIVQARQDTVLWEEEVRHNLNLIQSRVLGDLFGYGMQDDAGPSEGRVRPKDKGDSGSSRRASGNDG